MLPGEKKYAEKVRHDLVEVLVVGQALLELAVDIVAQRLPTVSVQVQRFAENTEADLQSYLPLHARIVGSC